MPSSARRWLSAVLACWLAAGLLAKSQADVGEKSAPPVRDWKTYPAVIELDARTDVYALGDVHGDYERLLTLLVAGKIIPDDPSAPEKVRWVAGRSILVCTGDMIDKGPQSLSVLQLMQALQKAARAAGGRVVVLMGNHEAEFLAGEGRNRKAVAFIKELTSKGLRAEDVAAGRDALGVGAFLRGLPFAARVNDWFFAHAGNTHKRSLADLQRDLREGVDRNGFNAKVLSEPDSLLQARLNPAPWWEKPGEPAAKGQERLARNLKALGVHHLVIGHQPSKVRFADGRTRERGQMWQQMQGLIFLIDVGMSRQIGYSTGALLHIHAGKPGRASVIYPNGAVKLLWAADR